MAYFLCASPIENNFLSGFHGLDQDPTTNLISSLNRSVDQQKREEREEDSITIHEALKNKSYPESIKVLLSSDKKLVQSKLSTGNRPIHTAVKYGCDADIIDVILAFDSKALSRKNSIGNLPLHIAVEHQPSLPLVERLINCYKEAVYHHNDTNKLPLHIALDSKASADVVSILLEHNPDAYRDEEFGTNALLHGLYWNASLEVIQLLIEADPDAIIEPNSDGNIPLSVALGHSSSEVILLLMNRHPEGILQRDEIGRLPLHLSLVNCCSYDVISYLISNYPEAVRIKDPKEDILPLHYALRERRDDLMAITSELLAAHPESVQIRDSYGDLPIHIASDKEASLELIELLINGFPEGIRQRDRLNRLPIHICLENDSSDEVILFLLHQWPESAKELNENGLLALHSAVRRRKIRISLELLRLHPDAASFTSGQEIALLLLKEEDDEAYIPLITALVLADMPVDGQGRARQSHQFSWNALIDPQIFAISVSKAITHDIMSKYRSHAKLLAYSSDSNGRMAIDVADREVKEIINHFLFFCGRFDLDPGYPLHVSATSIVLLANDYSVSMNCKDISSISSIFASQLSQQKDPNGFGLTEKSFKNAISLIESIYHQNIEKKTLSDDFKYLDGKRQMGRIFFEEFEQFCWTKFGKYRRVVLKLMKHQSQYMRERTIRSFLSNKSSTKSSIIGLVEDPDNAKYSNDIETLSIANISLKEYKYCIVMPAADRSLDAIYRYESPSLATRFHYIECIIDDLIAFHRQGIIHGDVKMMNCVRIHDMIRLIDFDASGRFSTRLHDDSDEEDEETNGFVSKYVGAKYSSGILPPEMFACLDIHQMNQYEAYWKARIDMNSIDGQKLWKKLAPVQQRDEYYVVRTFDVDEMGHPKDIDQLPYELIETHPSIDAWSVGMMIYTLFDEDGNTLLKTNKNDDVIGSDFVLAATWKRDDLSTMITNHCLFAKELIIDLLHPNPRHRMTLNKAKEFLQNLRQSQNNLKSNEILNSMEFLSNQINQFETKMNLNQIKNNQKIEIIHQNLNQSISNQELMLKQLNAIQKATIRLTKISQEILLKIEKTEKVLLRGMIESQDIQIPSSFIILNQKILKSKELNELKELNGLKEKDQILKANQWIDTLQEINYVVCNYLLHPQESLESSLMNLLHGKSLYLYLIDEYSLQPIVRDEDHVYPIEITTPAAFISKIFPLLKLVMHAMSMMNTISGIGRCLGYPLPVIPMEYQDKAKKTLNSLQNDTSIEKFGKCMNDLSLKSSESEEQTIQLVRGSALRELAAVLREYDPNNTFSGLRRVLTSEGHCCWTSDENIKYIDGSAIPTISEISYNPIPSPMNETKVASTEVGPITRQVDGANSPAIASGFIWKHSRGIRNSFTFKNWHSRYFVLQQGKLIYYVQPSPLPPYGITEKGRIQLSNGCAVESNGLFVNIVCNQEILIALNFRDENMKRDWTKAIQEHIDYVSKV